MNFDKVVIVGLGLIGGSLAVAIKDAGIVRRVAAISRSASTLEKGLQMGVVDDVTTDWAEALDGADIVVLCAPIGVTETLLTAMKPHLEPQTIITDAGSVKGHIVTAAQRVFGEVPARLVPGHPIAGSEKSGVEASNGQLYQNHKVILTPTERTDRSATAKVTALWEAAGAYVVTMPVDVHDDVLAQTSHLPHFLAFSLVETLAKNPDNQSIFEFAAGGFRDFTRIAASDPAMWHDIFIANQDSVFDALDAFVQGLDELRDAVTRRDREAIFGVLTRAQSARQHFQAMLDQRAYQQTSATDAANAQANARKSTDAKDLNIEPQQNPPKLTSKQSTMSVTVTESNDSNDTSTENPSVTFTAKPGGQCVGDIRVPGDKSISHRSIMLGALANGVTEVEGFLEGEDSLATLQAFRDMGVVIEGPKNGRVTIHGVGLKGLTAPTGPLYVGNSGTSMRLLAGLMAGQDFEVELTGDHSLTKRPMERVAKPLREMGADVETAENGCPPMKIKGRPDVQLKGIHYDMPMASAQVKSCVLLAGLYAEGESSVTEPAPTRDHTERMLQGFGYPVQREGDCVTLQGGGELASTSIDVPADISSAAFFMVAASIAEKADLTLRHVGINPTRTGVIAILKAMGADIELLNEREIGGEPIADIRVRSSQLKGIDIPESEVPLAIDEFPVLFVAAACAEGQTRLTGAEELRVKESDRIQVMADGLVTLGIDAVPTDDGMVIQGVSGSENPFGSGTVQSHGDHRIAMAFSVASLRATGNITIEDCANVATSFPNFVALAAQVGIQVEVNS